MIVNKPFLLFGGTLTLASTANQFLYTQPTHRVDSFSHDSNSTFINTVTVKYNIVGFNAQLGTLQLISETANHLAGSIWILDQYGAHTCYVAPPVIRALSGPAILTLA